MRHAAEFLGEITPQEGRDRDSMAWRVRRGDHIASARSRRFRLPIGALRVKCAAMTIQAAVADTSTKTVTFGGKTYSIQALSEDSYTVLLAGIPVGRVVYSFGAANGVPEGDAISEDDLYAIAEAWFAAVDG